MGQVRTPRWAVTAFTALTFAALVVGCGPEQPQQIDPEKYKEAKKQHDLVRAKEYGRKSITDKKASSARPPRKRPAPATP